MKKKTNPPQDWSHGWLAASFMSTAATLGIVPPPAAPGDDDKIEQEITLQVFELLQAADIVAEITAAVLMAQPPSTRWRYIGVVKTEFGPTTCMLDASSAAGLAEQAVFWANNFIYKYNKAVKMMERLDKMTLYLQTDLRNRRGSRKRKEEKDA